MKITKKSIRTFISKTGICTPPKSGLTEEERQKYKSKFESILKKVARRGIDELMDHLENSFFYKERCNQHHQYEGGLLEHSLEVYETACKLCKGVAPDSIAIAALLHDLGDIEGGQGHRSVQILERWNFELNDIEKRAIKYHMWTTHSSEEKTEFERFAQKEDLWRSITVADIISAGGYQYGEIMLKTILSIWLMV